MSEKCTSCNKEIKRGSYWTMCELCYGVFCSDLDDKNPTGKIECQTKDFVCAWCGEWDE